MKTTEHGGQKLIYSLWQRILYFQIDDNDAIKIGKTILFHKKNAKILLLSFQTFPRKKQNIRIILHLKIKALTFFSTAVWQRKKKTHTKCSRTFQKLRGFRRQFTAIVSCELLFFFREFIQFTLATR